IRRPPSPHLFPYTTLFRSFRVLRCPLEGGVRYLVLGDKREREDAAVLAVHGVALSVLPDPPVQFLLLVGGEALVPAQQKELDRRSEEHTSELQSRSDLVCR